VYLDLTEEVFLIVSVMLVFGIMELYVQHVLTLVKLAADQQLVALPVQQQQIEYP
jgi:hypothetical protein